LLSLREIAIIIVIALGLEIIIAVLQWNLDRTLALTVIGEEPELRSLPAYGVSRVGGTVGHPNELGTYIVSVIPICYALYLGETSRFGRLTFFFILLGAISVLVLTLSRGGWVGCISSLMCFMIISFLFRARPKYLALYSAGALIMLVVVIFMFWPKIHSRLYKDDYGAAYSRVTMAKVAFDMAIEHPWTGVGLNNYVLLANRYAPSSSFEANFPAHSMFPLIAAETGLVSLLVFILFVLMVIQQGIRKIQLTSTLDRLLYTGFFSGFIGFIIANQFGTAFLWNPLLIQFWFFSGILNAKHSLSKRKRY
jgi:O-antigen ligase